MHTLPDWGENSYINSNSNVNTSSKIIVSNLDSPISELSNIINNVLMKMIKKNNLNYDQFGKIPFPKEILYNQNSANGIDLDEPF